MKTQKVGLVKEIEALEFETITEMKDTLADFFSAWVVETSRGGVLEPEDQAFHFSLMKSLLNSIEEYKTENNHYRRVI